MSAKANQSKSEVEEGVLTTPDGHALPRTVDKTITMDVVQRFVETERMRSRRAILLLGTTFVFVILVVLVLVVGIGLIVMRHAKRATEDVNQAARAVHEMRDNTAAVAAEMVEVTNRLTGVTTKLDSLESGNNEIWGEIQGSQDKYVSSDRALKKDLLRFRDAVVGWNAEKAESGRGFETRLREMELRAQAREKEMAALREKYSQVLATAIERRVTSESDEVLTASTGDSGGLARVNEPDEYVPAEDLTSEKVDTRFLDIASIGPEVVGEPQGEISVVTFPNGDRYEGEFKDGFFHGWGTLYFRNGDRYEGHFEGDTMAGKGTHYYRNGDRFEGEFKENMKTGKGRMFFANGDRYGGDFQNDMINGKGMMVYENGNKYSGNFRNGLKHGNGIFSYANGDVYEGGFDEDLRHGRGSYVFSNGAKYIGEFKVGQKSGDGRYVYPNGQEYRGEFRDGKKHGRGLCIYPNGRELRGIWENDEFIRETRS